MDVILVQCPFNYYQHYFCFDTSQNAGKACGQNAGWERILQDILPTLWQGCRHEMASNNVRHDQ